MEKREGMIEASGRVLVVDDHRQARESIADVLRHVGHDVSCCSSAAEALRVIERSAFDCIITDLQMPGMSGLEFIVQLECRQYGAQVVMVTAHASVSSAVEAMRHGAFDYIEKPFDVDQLESLVGKAIRNGRLLREANRSAASGPSDVAPLMIGTSPAMCNLRDKIARIAPTPETVLIHGESGTGKELVAKTIHAMSSRASGPMISLNCPVLSAQLMESELFGHERGAFTGAEASRTGRFEMAHEGSILLDEVTEIDLNLQAKLLRVLQERSFERVGSSETIEIGRSGSGHHESRPEAGSYRRAVSGRPLLPPCCGADRGTTTSESTGRRAGVDRAFSRSLCRASRSRPGRIGRECHAFADRVFLAGECSGTGERGDASECPAGGCSPDSRRVASMAASGSARVEAGGTGGNSPGIESSGDGTEVDRGDA